MAYQIEISPTAIADIEAVFQWIKVNSPEQAYHWVRGCYEVMLTLEKFPKRCKVAIESQYMDVEVRQLLYDKQYRILFTISETEAKNGTIQIHRVRRASQQIIRSLDTLLGDNINT